MEKVEKRPRLTDLSVKCSKELKQRLEAIVRLERCRSLKDVVVYFLEVMLHVAKVSPRLCLTASSRYAGKPPFKGQLRGCIPTDLYDNLQKIADEYGLDYPQLVRIFLQMAMECYDSVVPRGAILKKEEIARRIRLELMRRKKNVSEKGEVGTTEHRTDRCQ